MEGIYQVGYLHHQKVARNLSLCASRLLRGLVNLDGDKIINPVAIKSNRVFLCLIAVNSFIDKLRLPIIVCS
jgi:hypothetical protein